MKLKLKTKKALIKRINVSATRLKRGSACKRHNLRRRSTNMKRQTRDLLDVHVSHERAIARWAPYSRLRRMKSKAASSYSAREII
ncbi:50S ribosomal protein L35 [Candidatus Cytomitobacter indipagum]|uniref:50S ribosomal protein L35 n=1 Tax=Candidatus Cytomitobacter indipagum TaxID=2601575 RepID=A0A5C0UDC0_9PROT|nr:50S ribosomal protein L35 [Candidatus Cytomitobacter indipagum]QEK37978.1 50S ribosomal protein L35 [Candidatus Cytomitobacter indipagum]